jgi:hypothetical protein
MLNGAHPFADGKLHHWVAERTRRQHRRMPAKCGTTPPVSRTRSRISKATGCRPFRANRRCGSTTAASASAREPLVTGFDTHWLCQRVAEQEKPWTWHLLNWRIAAKEFAISGAEHNQRIRDKQFPQFLKETLFGNHRLVRQMQSESPHFIVDDSLAGLAKKMNALTCSLDIDPAVLQATADAFDANFAKRRACRTTTRSAASCMRASGTRPLAHLQARAAANPAPARSSPSTCN